MASVFLKWGKGKHELAATDTLLRTFPCKVVSLGQDRHIILFQSIPYSFCIVIGVNKRAAFILIQFECRVEEGRRERHLEIRSYSSDKRGRQKDSMRICCGNGGRKKPYRVN